MDGLGARANVAVTEQERIVSLLTEAGFEVYRCEPQVVHLAERVRMHLMDSGVAVLCAQAAEARASVRVTFRCQRSDFPTETPEALHQRIVDSLRAETTQAGFEPCARAIRNITNPVDESHVLDVWYEVTYLRSTADDAALRSAVTWAMQVPKCITP